MFELDSRELASVIIVAAFVATFALIPRLRKGLGPDLIAVVQAFFIWKIQLPLVLYFAYALGIVYLASNLGAWNNELLKDTLIVIFFVGLPMLFSANKVKAGNKLVGDVIRDVIGVSALLVFYLGLGPLPLWGELLVQPLVILLAMMAVVARHNPEHRVVEKSANGLLAIIGLSLIAYTTRLIVSTWDTEAVDDAIASFVLSVSLPITLIPFVYVFAFIMHCETILTMLPFVNEGKQPKLRIRLACIMGLHFSTRLATEFTGPWRGKLARSAGLRDAIRTMREFRHAVTERDSVLSAYTARLTQLAGVDGVDEDGLRHDRREFHATKKELTSFYFMQMGWHRNRGGKYRPELLDFLGDMSGRGLPAEHSIQLVVRKDGQAWRAWRQTVGGWFLGVGGTANLEYQWQYDGPAAPTGFPSERSPGWLNATVRPSSTEWAHDDGPPTRP